MNVATSVYLDLVRFSAAMLVFFYHASFLRFDGAWLKGLGSFGHDAVIIFFVLSGFVIGYVSQVREADCTTFFKNRLARLYSVAIPALILTVLLDQAGKMIDPSMYMGKHYIESEPVFRVLANLFFVNELWFNSWRAFSNGPFWSLSYEFWYYVIFSSYFYFTGFKRILLTAIAMLIAGPKILILFPAWLLGLFLYRISSKIKIHTSMALVLIILPMIIYSIYRYLGGNIYLLEVTKNLLGSEFTVNKLHLSQFFLNDYIVSILVAMHLIGVISVSKFVTFSDGFTRIIRYFSGITFSLYLFHYPLLQFFGSIDKNSFVTLILTFLTVLILASYTEKKKKLWLKWVSNIFDLFAFNRQKFKI